MNYEDANHHIVILERGQKLMQSLTDYCRERNINGASLTGLGAVSDVDLGYYDLPSKTYLRKVFTEEYELVSMIGNVSYKDDPEKTGTFVHAHVQISDREYQCLGGHLFEATVAVTAEISLQVLPTKLIRNFDSCTGLYLIADHRDNE